MMKNRLLATLVSMLFGVALVCGTATAASAAVAPQNVHSVYCQTPDFWSYVKFSTPSHPTPGSGPVCYDGTGTAAIDLTGVTRFDSGAHFGSFQYRQQPGLPIIYRQFRPGQQQNFTPAVEVISLTISS
ncbi:MAG: hypothetical protein ACRDSP_04480 [Pseudonocardiaceae bacterium]